MSAAKKQRGDARGDVVLVEQWPHEHGPDVWFVPGYGRTAHERVASALRTMLSVVLAHPIERPVSRAWVQVSGQWVPA